MIDQLSVLTTDEGAGAVFDAFFAGYQQAFTLPEEMEDRDGFAACLALNHGKDHERLTAQFGSFRELCLTLHQPDGQMVAGANFIALGSDDGVVTVNLNYIYVLPTGRGRGFLRSTVQAVRQTAADTFGSSSDRVLILIEQNDPLRMSQADQQRDTEHSGMGQYDRLAIWGRQGAQVIDFPYVQPPLSPEHAPNNELILSIIGATEQSIAAALMRRHLQGFFGISVAKGDPIDASARAQLDLLAAMESRNERVRLIDPMPSLSAVRPLMGDWPDFRTFARHTADQPPISL